MIANVTQAATCCCCCGPAPPPSGDWVGTIVFMSVLTVIGVVYIVLKAGAES